MKKLLFLVPVLVMGMFLTMWSCEEEQPVESCEQEEICTDKNVTACCLENVCYYKFNDVEYPSDSIARLATDLGCTSKKSDNYQAEMQDIMTRLEILVQVAKANQE